MTSSLRRSSLSRISCLALALAAGPGCGGSEPAPLAPAPTVEEHGDTSNRVSTSAEIGGLNEEKVDKTFQRALSDFQRCLDDGAKRVEFLGGSVSFFLKIDADGKVDHAHLEKSTIGDRETEKCMLDSLRNKKWPKPVGGMHGLARKSFDFDPPNDVRAPTSWDGEHVTDAVGKLSKKVSACKKGESGAFEATLYVATDGSVMAAGVTPPSEAGESDVDCLVATLKAATLPSPGSWPAKVTFSL
ncbi:MAG TPA: AgmX/PglI C-terminal domain-containing protein [Polyangiaceae bacterium]|nr:AgmX/PglI C-terminal domain-containing protein [Polyangiaceae bacterium]